MNNRTLQLKPTVLKGTVTAPPSKSMAHRAVICNALAKLTSDTTANITNISLSKDIEATYGAVAQLQAAKAATPTEVFCNESGSTLRFIIPIAAALGGKYTFTGAGRLSQRPIDAYVEIFTKQGIENQTTNGGLPYTINGKLKAGTFSLRGDVSSQYISGLLFALPLLEGDSVIDITTKLESKPYVDLTMAMLQRFGIEVTEQTKADGCLQYLVKGGQRYQAKDYRVEGDFSQAAFWEVAKALGMPLTIEGVDKDSRQGDKAILQIAADLATGEGKQRDGYIVDASQIPDLVPIITVMAALSEGTTHIVNAARLRIKESDRLAAVSNVINKMGGDITELPDGLTIKGNPDGLQGGVTVDSYNDHRIAMSVAVATLKCKEPVVLTGAESVQKSYPDFWEVYAGLGGIVNELNLG